MYFCHGPNHSRGVLLLFAKNVDVKVEEVVKDVDGRFILLKGLILGNEALNRECLLPNKGKYSATKKLSWKK